MTMTMLKHSTRSPTPEESARLAKIKQLGCIACRQRGLPGCGTPEAHHLIRAGRRIGHHATVALCPWHHRSALANPGDSSKEMERVYGPSLARNAKAFHAEFGDDGQLLARQNAMLRLVGFEAVEQPPRKRKALTSSKVIPRGEAR